LNKEREKEMLDKGQIVEIPASSAIYKRTPPTFHSKNEELRWLASPYHYDLFDGILIGGHQGVENYHLGQRKHLNISGMPKPLYIIAIDKSEQRIFVGAGRNHPGLFSTVFFFPNSNIHWGSHEALKAVKTDNGIKTEILTEELATRGIAADAYLYDEGLYLECSKKQSISLYNKNLKIILLHDGLLYAEIYHLY